MFPTKPQIRSLEWTCPQCGAVEVEVLDWPETAIGTVKVVEAILLTCEECEKKRSGVSIGYPARHEAHNRCGGSTPPETNRVFDKRTVAPDY